MSNATHAALITAASSAATTVLGFLAGLQHERHRDGGTYDIERDYFELRAIVHGHAATTTSHTEDGAS